MRGGPPFEFLGKTRIHTDLGLQRLLDGGLQNIHSARQAPHEEVGVGDYQVEMSVAVQRRQVGRHAQRQIGQHGSLGGEQRIGCI